MSMTLWPPASIRHPDNKLNSWVRKKEEAIIEHTWHGRAQVVSKITSCAAASRMSRCQRRQLDFAPHHSSTCSRSGDVFHAESDSTPLGRSLFQVAESQDDSIKNCGTCGGSWWRCCVDFGGFWPWCGWTGIPAAQPMAQSTQVLS